MMKQLVLVGALLGSSLAGAVGTVATLRTSAVTYVLSSSLAAGTYALEAKRTDNGRVLWRVPVPAEARELHLAGSAVLINWCFSGAYLACGVQAIESTTGRRRWAVDGQWVNRTAQFLLVEDAFFQREDEVGSFIQKYRVVRIADGAVRTFVLQVPPRQGCSGPVALDRPLQFTSSGLTAHLRDQCGVFTKTLKS